MVNLSPWRFTIHICCGTSDFISVKLRLDVSVVSAEPNKRHNHRCISFRSRSFTSIWYFYTILRKNPTA